MKWGCFICVCFLATVSADEGLFRDLLTVNEIDCRLGTQYPVHRNHLFQGGYLNMPSARMGQEGEVGAGYAYVSPYRLYNLQFQLLNRLELSANYRVFKGIVDPVLSDQGFGEFSDKGANWKVALLHPEDSQYLLPGIAVGMEDFLGTRAFRARYVVLTQLLPEWNLEVSLGYGARRIDRLFGGAIWMPFRQWCGSPLQGFGLIAEYDATPYQNEKREPHPDGRRQSSKWNIGASYHLWNCWDLSLSYLRGQKMAFSVSTSYNFGTTSGFLPKVNDQLPYNECCACENLLVEDLIVPFAEQGLDLLGVWLSFTPCNQRVLRLQIHNRIYRHSCEVANRITALLGCLIPYNIDRVIVTIESEGLPLYDLHYCMEEVLRGASLQEQSLLFPKKEPSSPDPLSETLLFSQSQRRFCWVVLPKLRFVFGSSKGKFKHAAGISAGAFGLLPYDVYYSFRCGWLFHSDLYDLRDVDRLNPSRIINVKTDVIRYYQERGITLDEAYLQKNWHLGRSCYGKIAFGYFEPAYAGCAAEFLYYQVLSDIAVGFEGALLRKRTYSGLGFSDRVRQLRGPREKLIPEHHRFLGTQFFASLYYDLKCSSMDFKLQGGKFLANDYGARLEISKYFPSGLRITFWYTRTNGRDIVNNQTYYDKGISFSMPLEIFSMCSKKERWGYGMSTWLRDVGVIGATGKGLYDLRRFGIDS